MSWCHLTSSPPRGALKLSFEWWNFTLGPSRSTATSVRTDCDANSQYVSCRSVGELRRRSRGSSAECPTSRSYRMLDSVSARLASTNSSVTRRSRSSDSESTRPGTATQPLRWYCSRWASLRTAVSSIRRAYFRRACARCPARFGRGSSAGRQDCRALFARQHEFDRLSHLLGVHTRANAERLVERCQDAYDHRHQHGHAAERGDPTRWAGGVVADEQKEHEKGTDVDHD